MRAIGNVNDIKWGDEIPDWGDEWINKGRLIDSMKNYYCKNCDVCGEANGIKLYHGDCLEIMDKLIEQGVKIDMILTDPPYGTTVCKWNSVIPFEQMWDKINKLIKPNGAIALFGSEPFSSALRMSNINMFKYDWIWGKRARC